VDPVSVAGSISGSATVCSGTNSTELTLSGYVGSIQWQSSTDDITFADISGATSSTYTATDIAATTYYRAVVTSGACSSATTFGSTEITENPVSEAGSISGATTVCGGTNSTVLTLSGQTGSIQWQSSTDNITFSDIVGATGTTYTATNLTATTYYQAVVTSGVCAPSTTASVEMTVSSLNAGVIADAENAVCTGTNSTLLTVTGATGTIQWQSSADDLTFADISGENGTTYTATNLTATTFYRVVVSGGVCPPVQSASVVIDVFGPSVSGSISGEGTVCEGSPAELTLTGNTGTIQWQSSSDDITFTNISGATSANYSIPSVTGTTYYRVVVMNGACSSATSASVMVASGGSTTWDGSAWSNGAPTSTVTAYISGNYNESVDINACNLFVDNNAVVVIPTGFDVSLNGALIVTSGSFTLENAANLLQSNNVANSGNIIVKRNSSSIRRQDYTLWSSPVAGQSLLAFSPFTVTSPTSRFYQYNSSTNLYNSISSPGSVNFNDAQGYLIRVANNHPAFPWIWNGQFTGVPHNGDYSYTMFNGGAGFRYNLVGNPYPSPVSMTAFIAANSSQITGTLYFWRETNGNPNNNPYCTWSPAAGGTFVTNGEASVVDPQGIIETGQGFFVEASATGSAVSFTNAMRVGNNANQFFRPATIASNVASDPSRLWLNITNTGGAFCQTAIVYTDDATNGFDLGIDGRLIGQAATQLYSIVDTEKLSIQARAPFMPSDIVQIAFKATTAGEYSIAIDHVDGLFTAGQAIYIKDNLTVTQHLLNDGPYQFTTDAGEFTSRFEIVYEAALGTVNPTLDNTVRIIKNNGAFTINSGNATINNVQVFDIRGRLLTQLNDVDATQTSFTVNGTNQVLIVKIKSVDGQLVTRKVMN
jgi:6,7-dimethyl-8-ribityllumazine synthase